jgi:hypothetical protein
MGIPLDQIKDPRLRRRVMDSLSAADEFGKLLEKAIPNKKRIRQSTKPLMNKLENEFFVHLVPPFDHNGYRIVPQSVRFMLANGLWYKPDFLKIGDDTDAPMVAYEVKGPHSFRGGFENLKMAAHQYPWIKWILVWKENGQWQEQTILP